MMSEPGTPPPPDQPSSEGQPSVPPSAPETPPAAPETPPAVPETPPAVPETPPAVPETPPPPPVEVPPPAPTGAAGAGLSSADIANKKLLAGIMGIVFGAFGVHKFILGYQKEGIIMLVVSLAGVVLTCVGIGIIPLMAAGIVGLIEGILYLTKSDAEFEETYIRNRKPWF